MGELTTLTRAHDETMKNPLIAPEEIELYRSQSNAKYIILAVVIAAPIVALVWAAKMGAYLYEFVSI